MAQEKKRGPKKAKRAAKPESRKGLLRDAPVEQYFILCNGQPVKNVKELADFLEELSDDVFYHHVTPDRNDFATWINDVFSDADLAKELAGIKDKSTTRIVLYKHLTRRLAN